MSVDIKESSRQTRKPAKQKATGIMEVQKEKKSSKLLPLNLGLELSIVVQFPSTMPTSTMAPANPETGEDNFPGLLEVCSHN